MTTSNFRFLNREYPNLTRLGTLAERNVYDDPSTSLTKLRILAEKITLIIGEFEGIDDFDRQRQVDRLRFLDNDRIAPPEIIDLFHRLRKSGNIGAHTGQASSAQARFMIRQAFYLAKWFFELYENEVVNIDYVVPAEIVVDTAELDLLKQELYQTKAELEAFRTKAQRLQSITEEQKEERKERSRKIGRRTEETEAETRDRIDQQLRDAGWECDTLSINYKTKKTLPAKGKYLAIAEWKCGKLWADYALFIGFELIGIVEAKKHSKNVMGDLQQAKNYSKAVQEENQAVFVDHRNSHNYSVPFLFSTNGRPYLEQMKTASGIWFWDGRNQTNREKALTGWLSPRDLKEKLAFDQDKGAEKLIGTPYDLLTDPNGLSLRPYQVEAIKAVENKILTNKEESRSLLAMATGTGKTRTMIGLCYRLIASGRFRRILFLVDRNMLGKQAQDAFKEVKIEGLQTFAQIYDLQELKNASAELDTRIHFATVQSMVHRIAYSDHPPPSVGDYDCIVVDEAHRGYTLDKDMEEEEFILRDQLEFQSKYRMVLDHFDAYRIGLTATPAVHTAEIFGHPVYTYSYRRAVIENYLIDFEPPVVFQTRLGREGIVWNPGDHVRVYDPEENEIKDAGVTDDEIKVEIQGFNRRVFNDSFNRTILRELISNPKYAIDPEDKKKTLIFAATDQHADMIVNILQEEYEELGASVDADAIVKITGAVHKRAELLKRYKNEQYPSIVVTVDLLTTGIDVPSICNLIFLRRVNSRILYDQMIGRATRKCDDIGKEVFKVYDCVGVSEIMAKEKVMKPVAPLVTKTFASLSEEIGIIEDEYVQQIKLDRIIAKLQRKLRSFSEDQMEKFQLLSGENTATDLAQKFKATDPDKLKNSFQAYSPLWEFLDKERGHRGGLGMLYSEVEDELEITRTAYSSNLKPKDYLESFNDFIKNNLNEMAALSLVCNKPASLTRKDLKNIKLILDEKGFNKIQLNTAYKEVTNQAIAADIIAHIRTAALGNALISQEERIRNAVDKLKSGHQWNTIQIKWLDKIEMQLLKETIITVEDLDQPPFSNDGGLRKLNKVFKDETENILNELNGYLYANG